MPQYRMIAHLITGDEALQAQVLGLKFLPMLQDCKNQVVPSVHAPYKSLEKISQDEELFEVGLQLV